MSLLIEKSQSHDMLCFSSTDQLFAHHGADPCALNSSAEPKGLNCIVMLERWEAGMGAGAGWKDEAMSLVSSQPAKSQT
jgi:hypothetical protein